MKTKIQKREEKTLNDSSVKLARLIAFSVNVADSQKRNRTGWER